MAKTSDQSLFPAAESAGSRYESLSALQEAHAVLRQSLLRFAEGQRAVRPDSADIRTFMARARATGTGLWDERERKAAQSILDYWSTELVSAKDATPDDFTPMLLAPAEGTRLPYSVSQEPEGDRALAAGRGQTPHQAIRVAAAARLWQGSGKNDGYLLFDEAITHAAQFRNVDPDIAALVTASEREARRRLFWKRSGITVLVTVLIGLLSLTTMAWLKAKDERDQATQLYIEERAASTLVRSNAENADKVDRTLEEAVTILRRFASQGGLSRSDLSPDLQERIGPVAVAGTMVKPKPVLKSVPDIPTKSGGPPPKLVLKSVPDIPSKGVAGSPTPPDIASITKGKIGYAPDFLGVNIALPGVTPQRLHLTYPNYSVVLDKERRLAAVTASNLDREKRIVLRRVPMGFSPDPRIPIGLQPEPNWFKSPEIDMGHLTTRQEIAWGEAFSHENPETAALDLLSVTNVLTNVTPQFDTFNRFVWTGVEQWVIAEHNKRASRVTIFTGPVLSASDPVIDGVRVPRSFWKMAVSTSAQKSLVVDAFMVSQFKEGSDEKIDRVKFVPNTYRIRVSEIEKLTGLDFGSAIRGAPTSDSIEDAPAMRK